MALKVKLLVYRPNWSWDLETEKWLKSLCIGYTLNFPCGKSQVGDVRADIDPKVNPDIIADLFKPLATFKPLQFDTVICDPPFKYYNKVGWIHDIAMLARRRIIFSTPPLNLHLKAALWKRTFFITARYGSLFLRIWQVFDRKIKILGDQPKLNEFV